MLTTISAGLQVGWQSSEPISDAQHALFSSPVTPLSHDLCDRFPCELHDEIIAHADRRSLCVCSLVCKAWEVASRYQLFQRAGTVRINRNNFRDFYELLATNRISHYVGRLELEQGGSLRQNIHGSFDQRVFQFSDHLRKFTGLTAITYLRLGWINYDAGPELCAALAQNFARLTQLELNAVGLRDFSELLNIVDALPLLRRLALVRVFWMDGEPTSDVSAASAAHPPPPDLHDLVVDVTYAAKIFMWLGSAPPTRLRRLALGKLEGGEDVAQVSRFLRAVGPALRCLTVHDMDESHPFDLSHNTHLLTFKITGIYVLPSSPTFPIAWVPPLLALPAAITRLAHLALYLHPERHQGPHLLDWPRVTRVLDAPMYARLQRVDVFVSGKLHVDMHALAALAHRRGFALRVRACGWRYLYGLHVFDG
ncbi:hypothetical protein C8J57DRAFT_1518259 [Mycena rebaudengoi]|nr:hypothetical protein C8J57DRAFT_1518259 [Mycena rebaudengoi]